MSRNVVFSENDASWAGLFGSKVFLGIGLLLVLLNVGGIFLADVKLSTLLFYFNMRFWSVYVSVALWTIVIWLAAESTEFFEDYLPFIRIAVGGCVLLTIILALRSSAEYSIWFPVAIVITVCCTIRSLLMLRNYWHEGGDAIDMEETQWFWGISGFLATALIIIGLMSIIHIKVPIHPGSDVFYSTSLLTSCRNGLQLLLRNGDGSFAIRTLGFFVFTASIAFIYIVGKWMLICLYKMRGD